MSIPTTRTIESPSTLPSTHEVAVRLYRSLETALTKSYAQRYDAGVVLHHKEATPGDASRMHIWVDYQQLSDLSTEFAVTHLGGPTYEVLCTVEDGDSRRFSFTVPQRTENPFSRVPELGERLASFLLGQLEKRLGRLILDTSEEEMQLET